MMEEITGFTNHLPVKIEFGEGSLYKLKEILQTEKVSNLFVVIDKGLDEIIPDLKNCLNKIENNNISITKYEKEPGEPTFEIIESITTRLIDSKSDAIVAVGGGSVIDSAKAARVSITQNQHLREFLSSEMNFIAPKIPLIAVPTTAGTGSEVSGGAVITNKQTNVKVGIANPLIRAQYAIVDPVLTYKLPKSITTFTGIDALAQGIAAIIAKVRTPIGNAVALESIRLASQALPKVVKDGSDKVARSQMACASLLAGLAMNISDCSAEHSLGHALADLYHLPHGHTIALVLVETLEREQKFVPELLERIADAMGEEQDGTSHTKYSAVV